MGKVLILDYWIGSWENIYFNFKENSFENYSWYLSLKRVLEHIEENEYKNMFSQELHKAIQYYYSK